MCMDAVLEDMAVVDVTEEDTEDRIKWTRGGPLWRPLAGEAERRSLN